MGVFMADWRLEKYDTTAEEYRTEIYRKMSPFRKWEEWRRLQSAAWALKHAGVKAAHPTWSEQEVKKAVRDIFLYAVT